MALSSRWRSMVLLLAGLPAGVLGAQEKAGPPTPPEHEGEFWEHRRRQKIGATAEIVLMPTMLGKLTIVGLAPRLQVFSEADFVPTEVPELNRDWFPWIRDNTPQPDITQYPEGKIPKDKLAYVLAHNQAIVNSHVVPVAKFIEKAEENDFVTIAHLWNQPKIYRGKVIPIKGRLIRLRKWETGPDLAKQGIPVVYEGWIVGPTKGFNPFWVVFPNLPEGLKLAEDMDVNVEFYGYFLKKIMYPASDNKEHGTAILVGPTVVVTGGVKKAEATSPLSFPLTVLFAVVGGLSGMAVLIFGFSWWFRRADLKNRQQIERIRETHRRSVEGNLPWMRSEGRDFPSESDTEMDVMKSEEPTGEHEAPPKNVS